MSDGNNEGDTKDNAAREKAENARSIWLVPNPGMNNVETMYRSCVSSFLHEPQIEQEVDETIASGMKRRLVDEDNCQVSSCLLEDWQRLAVEQLCMILCQSGRSHEAKPYLHRLGYVCRLASCVLDYQLEETTTNNITSPTQNNRIPPKNLELSNPIACKVWDNFLSPNELEHLKRVFEDRNAHYWTNHKYQVEPPSPYFSYIVPLVQSSKGAPVTVDTKFGCLGDIIIHLHQHLLPHFPKLKNSTMVEFWAHNRPHPTGHQFHFDSDNEGQGRMIKNPIMTAILYLSENSGGPSVVTNQTLASRHMASKAVMSVSTCPGRMLAFDGSLLHGVIPGKGSHSGTRRVTLMLAFWKRIRVRPGDTPGAARPYPFPTQTSQETDWNQLLVRPATGKSVDKESRSHPISQDPIPLDHVFETLDGQTWTKTMGFPEYDQVFQGF